MATPTVEKKSLRKEEFPDIQGIVLKGYKNLPCSKFVFLRIEETRAAKKWLAGVLSRVTSAAEKNPERAFNIGFTYLGLKRMGLGRATHSFPREFREGMANSARSLQLGDTGNSAPENWQVGGLFTREVHLLLAIYGKDKNATDDEYLNLIGGLLGSVFTHIYIQDAARPLDMKEPFGFLDGLSQPTIKGMHEGREDQDEIKAGEFLLGHQDEYGYVPPSPEVPAYDDMDTILPPLKDPSLKDFGRNGSYLVWRKLTQDVAGFRSFVETQAQITNRDQEWVAAKLVGRWRNGVPLVHAPDQDNSSSGPTNRFVYSKDLRGEGCPITAHIRRANPRDGLGKDREGRKDLINRHRIIRRGMPFKDQDEEGLIFIAINADIARQFEFIQQSWLNNRQFNGLYDDKDPMTSAEPSQDGGATIPRKTVRLRLTGLRQFVTARGGGYFFLPSFKALKFLAREYIPRSEHIEAAEHPLPDESDRIREIITLATAFMEREYPPGVRPARRQAHSKTHGVVTAEFLIASDLPADLRCGVFQPGSKYDAWVRFSSAHSKMEDDSKGQSRIRGMAIKLMGVPGKKLLEEKAHETTQDFLLVNTPLFFSPDPRDFAAFMRATRFHEDIGAIVYAFSRPLKRLPKVLRMRNRTFPVTNPVTGNYWSAAPYRFGKFAVKYAVRPWDRDRWWRTPSSPEFLRQAMSEYLAKFDARFDFLVQFQTDPIKMPIEDATVEWDERDSPFIKVATIHIPRQTSDSEERMQLGEHMSFTPWHSLPEHQPLGSMNRIRKATYQALSEVRHRMNQVPQSEP